MGTEKIFGGAQINFFLKFCSEDQRKKDFYPKLRTVDTGRLPPFVAQFSLEGVRSWPGGVRRNLMVRISVPAHRFRGEDQKKEVLGAKS